MVTGNISRCKPPKYEYHNVGNKKEATLREDMSPHDITLGKKDPNTFYDISE